MNQLEDLKNKISTLEMQNSEALKILETRLSLEKRILAKTGIDILKYGFS